MIDRRQIISVALFLLATISGLRAQSILQPEDFTNRRLGLPGDASSVGWNPAILGMDKSSDIVGGAQYDTGFTFNNLSYGIFSKFWYLGAGTIGSTSEFNTQRFYGGFGFPLDVSKEIPLWVGGGVGWSEGTSLLSDGEFTIGAVAAPLNKLLTGLAIQDLLGRNGNPRVAFDANWRLADWLALRGGLYYNSLDTFGNLSQVTPEFGLDLWLFEQVIAVSSSFDFNREDFRFGVEMLFGRDIIAGSFNELDVETGNVGYKQGVGIVRYRPKGPEGFEDEGPFTPPSTRLGWAPDRAYTPAGLSYKYAVSDATEDPLALKRPCDFTPTGFDTPADLFETVRTGGGSYRMLFEALEDLSSNPNDLFKNIRKSFYSRRVRSTELMKSDSLTILSRQNYSIGIQNLDNSQFPFVSVYMQVTDNEGRSVRGLGRNDFTFADPSLEIVSVRPIDSSRRIPVDVTMIIDCSGSMGGEIEAVRANAQSFVDHMETSGADYRIGGVLYGSIIYDTLHPTNDFQKFRKFVSNAAAIGGDEISALAVKAATEMNYRPDAQRIFVLITDDWAIQQNSELTEADLVAMLWEMKARLYSIHEPCKNNSAVTTRLTLGQEYNIRSPFTTILDEIGTDITTTYELVYKSKMKEAPKVTILRGRVKDDSGRPVGTTITMGESLNSSTLNIPTNSTTGEYEVEIVEGKIYQAEINSDLYLPLSESVDLTGVQKGDTVYRDFTLYMPQTTLRGQILDQNNRGIRGKVQIDDAETLETVMIIETDQNGRYQTAINEGRVYRLTPVVPEYIPTPEELDTRGVKRGAALEKDLHVISIDQAIATGATFRLDNIFFDFDKSDLKSESIPELRKLVNLLNDYPSIRVEIGAHTDWDGTDDYNIKLSQRRAQSVVNWLIDSGVSESRLVSKGYGESKPIATNETDEGRALNRRVEFKLVR
ncbi:MAG: OmpA family protein [Ignavibacteriae bacterium]|nr:OmpA family protein [Ignavibacteriota bacterium]MCB9217660.1 OmpA family protein [Ignavibacteria bacterium]